jgi:hypothetical protein
VRHCVALPSDAHGDGPCPAPCARGPLGIAGSALVYRPADHRVLAIANQSVSLTPEVPFGRDAVLEDAVVRAERYGAKAGGDTGRLRRAADVAARDRWPGGSGTSCRVRTRGLARRLYETSRCLRSRLRPRWPLASRARQVAHPNRRTLH